ncbi:uncharacterized protein LOC100853636 [Vitis vinifera]|uniref:uncharacterized protein LOC100853636 n=1 Tax=Vitis vinifera TaxID=29760 RepID=UPI002883260B|nr:uncharacterized protein LOC100853636 [Vitis vinifera]
MAFHPGEYRIASAISSLKTQKANQWHYLNLPFGLFYSYYKLFEMTSCYAICSQSSLKSLTKPKHHSKSQDSTLQESSSFFSFLFLFTDKLRNPSSRLDSQMDFVNVLKFSAACFDLLAWPLFALGYPLCASIRVIETKSISDVRKLVTYWVLFSLISLFDHAFSELLEWIPFWPYIKLMIICWLVIPHFDGSHYVYQNLVCPCLSMDTQVVMNWRFNESKKLFHSRENFLVVADRYIKENGAEALAKLIASKLKSTKPNVEVKEIEAHAAPEKKGEQWKCEEPNVSQKEIQVVEVTEIKSGEDGRNRCKGPNAAKKEIKVTEVTQRTFGGTAHWVKQTELNLGETKSNTTCIAGIKERATALMTAEIEACRDDRTPEISLHKKVQKEWACAVCLLTTQSEATLNSHLQGKRHQATSEQLKAKNQATKDNGSPSASMAKISDQSTKEEQPKCTSNNLNSKNNGISAASTVKKPDETKDDKRQKCASSNGPNQKNKKVWACALCQVTTQSEATLNSHLQGKRHQATSEQLKAKNQAIKTNGSPSASMAKKSDGSTKEEQLKCTSNNLNSKNNGISAASTVKKPDKTKEDKQQKCASSNGPNQKNNKNWACALCQVTTQSEATLNSHLQGKRHQATSEQPKGKNKATKASGSPSASMAKKSDQSTKEEQLKCTSNNLNSKNNGISAASKVKKPDDTKDDERQKCASSNGRNQKNNKKQEKALVPETNEQGHQKNLKQTGDGMKELGSWCNICNVSCTSELDMASHLNGRRHFDSIKQLSELWCSNCNVKCNSEVDMASHQNGRRHLEQLKERLGLWCSICSVSCNSKVDMDSHLNGRRHLDQIEEQLRFWCGACNLMCNSELKMASHLNRRSHLKT